MIQRITSLTARIVDFSRYLRSEGYDISPDRESMALLAVENTVFNKTDFRHSLKSIFPTNRNTYLNFDGHFDQYFKETNIGVDSKIKEQKRETVKKQKQSSETRFNSLKNWLTGNKKEEEELAAYGGNTRLETKDFSAYSDEDLKKAEHIIRVFLKKIRKKSGRRKVWVNRSNTIDLQATMKKNFRKGIEINDLIFNRKKPKPLLIVILTDVSRSMEIYSRFFVQFMYAFEKVYPGIQTYVFGADLYKITDDFRGKDFKKVLNNIADHVPIWSGGTLIGKSLNSFVSKHFYQRVNSKTILMIVSDGLDTGNSESVAHSMKTLKRRTRKVVWINPLASHENYKPTAAAMAAAMPFIDQFISGHNLQSLKEMLSKLVK